MYFIHIFIVAGWCLVYAYGLERRQDLGPWDGATTLGQMVMEKGSLLEL